MAKKQKKKKINITLDDIKKGINADQENNEKDNVLEQQEEPKIHTSQKEIHKNITLAELEKDINKVDIEGNSNTQNTTTESLNENINNDVPPENNGSSLNQNEKTGTNKVETNDKGETLKNETINETVEGKNEGKDTEKPQEISVNSNEGNIGNSLNTDQGNINNTPQNGQTGDIQLDNLGTHIDTSSTTINVNDNSFKNTNINENNNNETTNTTPATNIENGNNEGYNLNTNDGGIVELDKINIEDHNDDDNAYLDLSGGSLYDIQKKPRFRYGKITIITSLISIITLAIGVVAYFYNDFITNDLSDMEGNRAYTFVESAKDFIKKANKSDGNTTIQSVNLIGKNSKKDLDNLINSDLNFIQKKAILNESISNLSNNIISKYTKLNDIKTDVTRYGFFPKDLSHIISESEPISSIQNSLIALEAIKFSSAISVFSYLDTFTTSLVQSLGIERDEIEEKVGKVTSRGETDINIYIKNCYLNPFESDYDCNYIGDFDEYYKNLNDNFDTKFFKELIKYTDSRLEQSEIPSFVITFKEFNQKDNEITFDIEINTLKEDEAELTKKGIISPHIFILQSLINSLRQSRFIVGDDISVKTLNVSQNSYIIGLSEINVNRSVNTFTVHIKKENAVEIDDFVYTDY